MFAKEGFFQKSYGNGSSAFSEIARDFLAYSKQEKRSYRHDVSRSETLLRLWRDCPLADLSPGRIERDLADCAEREEWTPATYNRHRALVSGIFSLAIRNGKAAANPARGTRHRVENNARVRYLTDDEENRLIEAGPVDVPGPRAPDSDSYAFGDAPVGAIRDPGLPGWWAEVVARRLPQRRHHAALQQARREPPHQDEQCSAEDFEAASPRRQVPLRFSRPAARQAFPRDLQAS
jgi:hypothetical protein